MTMSEADRIQVHLPLAYRHEPLENESVRRYLAEGYRIAGLQRVSDRDVLITFERTAPDA